MRVLCSVAWLVGPCGGGSTMNLRFLRLLRLLSRKYALLSSRHRGYALIKTPPRLCLPVVWTVLSFNPADRRMMPICVLLVRRVRHSRWSIVLVLYMLGWSRGRFLGLRTFDLHMCPRNVPMSALPL